MADYNEISLAQATSKAGIGQDFMRLVRDNLINHQDRLVKLEQGTYFNHCTVRHNEEDTSWGDASSGIGTGPGVGYDGMIILADIANPSSDTNYNPVKTAHSVSRIGVRTGAGTWTKVVSNYRLVFDAVTKPVVFEARLKVSADFLPFLGIRTYIEENPATDRHGIWVERVDSTNWRAVSYNGSRNNGPNFAKPTLGTWFRLRIEWTLSPDNAVVYIDGNSKAVLTSQLPKAQQLHVMLGGVQNAGVGGNIDVDLIDFGHAGHLDAA